MRHSEALHPQRTKAGGLLPCSCSLKGSSQTIMFHRTFWRIWTPLNNEDQLVMIGLTCSTRKVVTKNFKSLNSTLFRAPVCSVNASGIRHHCTNITHPLEQLERIKTLVTEHRGPIPLRTTLLCDDGKKIFLDTESATCSIDLHPKNSVTLELLVGEGQVHCSAQARPLLSPPRSRRRVSGMKHPLEHYIEYTLLLLFGITLRLLPLRIALLFRWLIALIGYHLVRFLSPCRSSKTNSTRPRQEPHLRSD